MIKKSIGEYLKGLREEQGLTLEEIVQATKIKMRFLEDIEKNRFDNLGGVGYAKAMIYTYGRFLKANLPELLELLNKRFPETVLPDFDEEPQEIQRKFFLSSAFIPIAIVLLFVIAFTILIIKTSHSPAKTLKPKSTIQSVAKPQVTKKNKTVIDTKVLKDTTNYLDKFLFKKKKNPFKADE